MGLWKAANDDAITGATWLTPPSGAAPTPLAGAGRTVAFAPENAPVSTVAATAAAVTARAVARRDGAARDDQPVGG
jgi:hypothetical protein